MRAEKYFVYSGKNKDVGLIYIADVWESTLNSDVGIDDGRYIESSNFCYESTGNPVGELVEKFLQDKYAEKLNEEICDR